MTDSVSYWAMVAKESTAGANSVTGKYSLRVQRKHEGGWVMHDIRGTSVYQGDDIPDNVRDRIALLLMVEGNDVIVPDVGYRFSKHVFYLDPDTL